MFLLLKCVELNIDKGQNIARKKNRSYYVLTQTIGQKELFQSQQIHSISGLHILHGQSKEKELIFFDKMTFSLMSNNFENDEKKSKTDFKEISKLIVTF